MGQITRYFHALGMIWNAPAPILVVGVVGTGIRHDVSLVIVFFQRGVGQLSFSSIVCLQSCDEYLDYGVAWESEDGMSP